MSDDFRGADGGQFKKIIHCGQLILREICKIDAIRWQILF